MRTFTILAGEDYWCYPSDGRAKSRSSLEPEFGEFHGKTTRTLFYTEKDLLLEEAINPKGHRNSKYWYVFRVPKNSKDINAVLFYLSKIER